MTLKKFSIISAVIAVLLIAVVTVLACVRVDNGINVDEPTKILVYAKTSTPITYSEEETPKKFNELKKLYKEMTNLTILQHAVSGNKIKKQPAQDVEGKNGNWTSSNKSSYNCIELKFDKEQKIIINVDGDTRVINFTALIMKIEDKKKVEEVAIYFSQTDVETDSKSYKSNPIIVKAQQNKLFEYIEKIAENKE